MTLEIPENGIVGTNLSAQDLLLELAVNLYDQEKISRAQVRPITGLDDYALEVELQQRGLGFDYDLEDLATDLKTLEKLDILSKQLNTQ